MNTTFSKIFGPLLFFICTGFQLTAQDIVGAWEGKV